MSDIEKKEAGSAAPQHTQEDYAGAVPPRRGKRRNCMFIPGTSDPLVAKMFSESLMKELGLQEAAPENPEKVEE